MPRRMGLKDSSLDFMIRRVKTRSSTWDAANYRANTPGTDADRPTLAGGRGAPDGRGGGGAPGAAQRGQSRRNCPMMPAAARFGGSGRTSFLAAGFGGASGYARPVGNRCIRWCLGCHRRFALGLLASDFAARPDIIIGAAGGRRQRFALDQRSRGQRIDRGRARAGTAEQLIGTDGRRHQRQDRSRQRARRWLAGQRVGVRRRGFGRHAIGPERAANSRVTSRST